MKKISKLFTTSALLICGALVSFGAMNDNASAPAPAAKPADVKATDTNAGDDFVTIIAITDPAALKKAIQEKLSTNEKAKSFLDKWSEKDSTLKADVKAKIKELKDKFAKEPAQNKVKPEHVDALILIIKGQQTQAVKPADVKPAAKPAEPLRAPVPGATTKSAY